MPSKIHPKSKTTQTLLREVGIDDDDRSSLTVTEFTVWKKSLVFHCNGFTVFDGEGKLAFRVDNYHAGPINEVLLMDAHGNSLLTMTRKRFSLHNEWQVFSGDKSNGDGEKPLFRMTRPRLRLPTKTSLAEIFVSSRMGRHPDYWIEGSYAKRSCTIYDNSKHIVAEVRVFLSLYLSLGELVEEPWSNRFEGMHTQLRRKQVTSEITLGGDVFDVRVQRGFNPVFVMGVMVILDQMITSNTTKEDGINFAFPSSWAWC